MTDLFPVALAFIWQPQNDGQGYHCTPEDPGSSTSWGTTFTTWAGWQRLHKAPVSMELFRAWGKPDFAPLYRSMFWNACRCPEMDPIAIQLFDAAVMSAPRHAGEFLQHVLNTLGANIDEDGDIGPATLAALGASDITEVNARFCDEREAFYQKLPTVGYFGRGWDQRAAACRDYVAKLLNHQGA